LSMVLLSAPPSATEPIIEALVRHGCEQASSVAAHSSASTPFPAKRGVHVEC
jgi:hypothetical protein